MTNNKDKNYPALSYWNLLNFLVLEHVQILRIIQLKRLRSKIHNPLHVGNDLNAYGMENILYLYTHTKNRQQQMADHACYL